MLPDSKEIKNNSNIYKFADTGIEELVRLMVEKGALQNASCGENCPAGAQMFAFSEQIGPGSG